MVRICVVNGCKKEAYPGCGISFHRFPVNEDVKRKWMEVLKISGELSKYAVVCSLHFRHEDFLTEAKKWLNPEAVPSVFPNLLPENKINELLSSIVLFKAENPMPGPSEESTRKKIKLKTEISTQTQQEFSTPRTAKLRRDIKILKQKLKRRDIKIKHLEDILGIIKTKCNNYVELENVINIKYEKDSNSESHNDSNSIPIDPLYQNGNIEVKTEKDESDQCVDSSIIKNEITEIKQETELCEQIYTNVFDESKESFDIVEADFEANIGVNVKAEVNDSKSTLKLHDSTDIKCEEHSDNEFHDYTNKELIITTEPLHRSKNENDFENSNIEIKIEKDNNEPNLNCDEYFFTKFDRSKESFDVVEGNDNTCDDELQGFTEPSFQEEAGIKEQVAMHQDKTRSTASNTCNIALNVKSRLEKQTKEKFHSSLYHSTTRKQHLNHKGIRKLKPKNNSKTNADEKSYACSYCDYKCNRKTDLKDHIKLHTGEKPHACSICDYKCIKKTSLNDHMKMHTGEKPYACCYCDYKSIHKTSLNDHIKIHTGEKPFACSYCDYKCIQRTSLKDHIKIHTGEKPYACSYCDYKCIKKTSLNDHLKLHTGEKPYACSHCDYKCIQRNALKEHLKKHSGEKAYVCTYCEYKCYQKRYLHRHMKRHTGEKPYACSVCEYKCIQKHCLTRHLMKHMSKRS